MILLYTVQQDCIFVTLFFFTPHMCNEYDFIVDLFDRIMFPLEGYFLEEKNQTHVGSANSSSLPIYTIQASTSVGILSLLKTLVSIQT